MSSDTIERIGLLCMVLSDTEQEIILHTLEQLLDGSLVAGAGDDKPEPWSIP